MHNLAYPQPSNCPVIAGRLEQQAWPPEMIYFVTPAMQRVARWGPQLFYFGWFGVKFSMTITR